MRFDVLSRHLNVFESHFLEASAGTGKTFAIEQLAVRLLIEGTSPLTIEQMLIVTFTRAAARELKMRIRRSLESAKKQLQQRISTVDYLLAFFDRGDKAIEEAIERIDAALICYDSACIYTLHGFCHRLLNTFALEADVKMQVNDPDEREHVPFLEQEVHKYLKEDLRAPYYSPLQIRTVLGKHQRDVRKMIQALMELAQSGREIAPAPPYQELLEQLSSALCFLPKMEAALIEQDLTCLKSNYKQMTGKEVLEQIRLLSEIVASKQCSLKQFDQLLSRDFFLENMREDQRKVRTQTQALHYPGLLEMLRTSLLPLVATAKDPSITFLRMARDLQKKAEALLQNKQMFSRINC